MHPTTSDGRKEMDVIDKKDLREFRVVLYLSSLWEDNLWLQAKNDLALGIQS